LENWTTEVVTEPLDRSADQSVIGFLGRPSVAKGVVVLAEAIAILAQRGDTPPRLVLCGESHFVPPAERDVIDAALRRIDGLVDRQGWTSPADFFGQVDVAVFPSLVPESFGLVAAEAMSARVPFIVSASGALPEVAGRAHPWVTPRGDATALADTIEAVLASPREEIASVVRSARRRWETHFSPVAGQARLARLLLDLDLM
jgi:glycosyltransferase involved in cell wall biosynthesis